MANFSDDSSDPSRSRGPGPNLDDALRGEHVQHGEHPEHRGRGERGEHGRREEHFERGGHGMRGERPERGEHGMRGERPERGERGMRGERPERGERSRVLGRGELPLVILALLDEAPRHGYDIIRSIEDRCQGAYAPSAGVIYPTLTMLEDQDLAVSAPASDSGKRQYRITDAGRRHAAENAGLIGGAFARMDMVARMRARETLPARVKQAMETLKQALMASGANWQDTESDRIAHAIETAALAIVAGRPASPASSVASTLPTSPASPAGSGDAPAHAAPAPAHAADTLPTARDATGAARD